MVSAAELNQARADFADAYVHRCTIQRATSTEGDVPGYDDVSGWATLAVVSCLYQPMRLRTGGERVTPEQTLTLSDGNIRVPAGTDVSADDRIVRIVDQVGETRYEARQESGAYVEGLSIIGPPQDWGTHLHVFVRGAS